MRWHVMIRKKLISEQFQHLVAEHQSCLIVFEDCSSATFAKKYAE